MTAHRMRLKARAQARALVPPLVVSAVSSLVLG
jgi:hypothetical protein